MFNSFPDFISIPNRARECRASNPRDHVYAFLSYPSARLGKEVILQADYTKTVQVYTEVAVKSIEHRKNFSLLLAVEHLR